jgi:hypothetical protein
VSIFTISQPSASGGQSRSASRKQRIFSGSKRRTIGGGRKHEICKSIEKRVCGGGGGVAGATEGG